MSAAVGQAGLRTLRERKRVVDAFVLASPIALLLASAIPWFFLRSDVDLAFLARAAFATAAAYLIAVMVIDASNRRSLLSATLYVSPFVGIAVAGVLWHLAGGISNPGPLAVFALPVLAAAVCERTWAPWTAALFAIATVGTIAMLESPTLAWYFTQWGAPVGSVYGLANFGTVDFSGISPSQAFTTIVAFAVSMLGVAAFGHVTIRKVTRESIRLALATPSEAGDLWRSALEAQPIPLAVVTAETARVVAASERFIEAMVVRRETVPGVELFEVLHFADRAEIEKLLDAGGRAEWIAYRVGPEARLASIEVRPFQYGGESYRAVSIIDWREVGHLIAAADALDRALLIVGTEDRRLRWANRPARAILGESWMGRDLGSLTAAASSSSVEVEGRVWAASSYPLTASTAMPEMLTVIVLDEPGAPA